MKLNEIAINKNDIAQSLFHLGFLDSQDFAINAEGVVDLHRDFHIDGFHQFYELPVQFGVVHGTFEADNVGLKTLKGAPRKVLNGYFSVQGNSLTSLEYAPSIVEGGVYISRNNITSLIGIDKIFKRIKGKFSFDSYHIEHGGIGLIMINGLSGLEDTMGRQVPKPFQIIEAYLGKPEDLYECQAELIDQGFEEYAKL